jgi:hypothetical protein
VLRGSGLPLDAKVPPSQGYAAGGSLYLTHAVPADEHTEEIYDMTRLDPGSGRVLAVRRFLSAVESVLLADGSLWVTTSAGQMTSLWKLDARSLAVQSEVDIPTSRYTEGIAGSLAVAGGHLWVAAGTLDRASLLTGRVDRVVRSPYRGPVQLASDHAGRVLLASLGYEHPVYIARLNPRSGKLVTKITLPRSVSQPTIGGIVDDGAWIENTVGARTTAWRIDVTTMRATRTNAWPTSSGRILVQVLDGVLWVTQPLGPVNLNYCANPITGQPLARLPLLQGDSVFLAADAVNAFYTDVPVNAHSVNLQRASIRHACVS